ncbi:N-formylglutamate amidohydrolase [Pseudoruegeria aquimaris]|uniref:N-formylglutamate amidohydrolase n=1 Tax=Pseudoruegeria aquimaris TaxID=393663 RepID=A0A1Y5RD06_9RHOB|nr:N-formylglutamate amidohydrolase [Pseudoruegeria aquimaris]SLN14604.1 N-formylglutamate amidohydrolase [Pseudoruegeria aquimaris]
MSASANTLEQIVQGQAPAALLNPDGAGPFLLACEHASWRIPEEFAGLGLTEEARRSHVAWDPGALEVAAHMARILDAPLVISTVSRLVYDCNRPPYAHDAMPARSERFTIPGNAAVTREERTRRTRTYYEPFRDLLEETLRGFRQPPVLVTVHSFTPTYNGETRAVELGILHDEDSRLADRMLDLAPAFTAMNTQRNAPYSPADGVTHTLKQHGILNGLLNVMLEIRNDLIATPGTQAAVAEDLARLLSATLTEMRIDANRTEAT